MGDAQKLHPLRVLDLAGAADFAETLSEIESFAPSHRMEAYVHVIFIFVHAALTSTRLTTRTNDSDHLVVWDVTKFHLVVRKSFYANHGRALGPYSASI